MADVTINELADVVGVSVEKLLSQVKEAGLPHKKADEVISNEDKNALLVFYVVVTVIAMRLTLLQRKLL